MFYDLLEDMEFDAQELEQDAQDYVNLTIGLNLSE